MPHSAFSPEPITDDNFELAYDQLRTAFFSLSLFDWAGLVDARRRADSYMHITDPTGYLKLINSSNAADAYAAAQAAAEFVRKLEQIRDCSLDRKGESE